MASDLRIKGAPGRRAYLNAHLIDASCGLDGRGGILIDDGRIVGVGPQVTAAAAGSAATIVDCGGAILLPGLIDMRVITGEPGNEHRETLASASHAAAAGGVTTMIVMPNTAPVIDDAAIVDFILRRARDTAIVRVVPMAAITKGLDGRQITEIGLLQEAGAAAVTDGTHAVVDAAIMKRALAYANDFGMLVVQHVEEPTLATGVMNSGEVATRLGLPETPPAAEVIMLERDIRLVELTGARYHAAQISCRESLEVVRRAKERGLPISCGVSVNHLVLNENDIGAYRTFFKISPPLRSEDDRLAMVEGVKDSSIDVIVSSHDPQNPDTKRLPFAEAEFGAIGLETMFSAVMRLHHDGSVPLPRLIEAMTSAPASVLGLETGRLQPGAPADLAIADLSQNWRVEADDLKSASKNSPFEHTVLEGRIIETIVAGRSVYSLDRGRNSAKRTA
ncbi:MAG: dihydroorotase [Aestuariivirgaceae bacterium]